MSARTVANVRTAIVLGGAAILTVASVATTNAMHAPAPAPAWISDAPIARCAWEDGSGTAHPCYWQHVDGTGPTFAYGPDGTVWRQDSNGQDWRLDARQ